MTIIASLAIIFTIIQLLVALTNLLSRSYLRQAEEISNDLISVLIPARNEENNIGNILRDLTDQDYDNIEIIVFNDQSADDTATIVMAMAEKYRQIRLIDSDGLPSGWLGKNYACHSLSGHAEGSYLLFLDADVRISKNLINNAISFSLKNNTSLISIFPKQIIKTYGEWITVPNMNYILVTLLPLILVRKLRFSSLSAANGQFMFFSADAYRSLMPHRTFRNHKVEDIAIARLFKKSGFRIACLLGDNDITCRMYHSFADSVNGFSKNVIAFFGNSFILAVLFWLITTFGFLAVMMVFSKMVFFLYVIALLVIRVIVSAASRQNIFYNLVFMIPLQISLGLFIYKAFINKHLRKFQWKGRSIE